MGHQAGRSIMEIVYMQSLEAEAAQYKDHPQYSAAYLWDLSNYYEGLNRELVWTRGKQLRFSQHLMAVALNKYGAQRFVGCLGVVRKCDFPKYGIPAGCGFATYLVQVYSLPPLRI